MFQDFKLLTEQPLWFAMPALLAGLGYAYLLYYSSKPSKFSKRATLLLFLFRFITISLIAGLLLGPFFRQTRRTVQQPKVIFLHDNSISVTAADTGRMFIEAYHAAIAKLEAQLPSRMKVAHYLFGSELVQGKNPSYNNGRTDISAPLRQISGMYYRQNVGAIVLLTDGIHNSGIDPRLEVSNLSFPIYTVGLGDTTNYPDLSIADVRYNRFVRANSQFPVEITVLVKDAAGIDAVLDLFMDDQLIGREPIKATGGHFEKTIRFEVKDAPSGQRRFLAQISGLAGERALANNRREFFIEVLGQKQRILLLSAAPHPDLGAIQAAASEFYDIEVKYLSAWEGESTAPELLILHELPAIGTNSFAIEQLLRNFKNLPVWFINGPRTDANAFNRIQEVYQMLPYERETAMDAFPSLNPDFGLFKLEDFQSERIARLPALNALLADWEIKAPAVNLLRQRLRGVETAYPLWSFYETSSRRMAFVSGTGLWRWRLNEFQRFGSSEATNELIRKTISYLVIRPDERRLRLFAENIFSPGDEIVFRAELYNQSMELVNEPELMLTVMGNELKYEYAFYRSGSNDYRLNIGRLPPGNYTYKAETSLAGEQLSMQGQFIVSTDSPEQRNLKADHELLKSISAATGGVYHHFNQIDQLAQALSNDSRITSTASYSLFFDPVLGQLWALVLLLILLAAEWLLRKYLGSY